MPLRQVSWKPVFGFGWLARLVLVPSKDKTRQAQVALRLRPYPHQLVRDFALGRLNINDRVIVNNQPFIFLGAWPETEFPEAMVFWAEVEEKYIQFTLWGVDEYRLALVS